MAPVPHAAHAAITALNQSHRATRPGLDCAFLIDSSSCRGGVTLRSRPGVPPSRRRRTAMQRVCHGQQAVRRSLSPGAPRFLRPAAASVVSRSTRARPRLRRLPPLRPRDGAGLFTKASTRTHLPGVSGAAAGSLPTGLRRARPTGSRIKPCKQSRNLPRRRPRGRSLTSSRSAAPRRGPANWGSSW